MATKLTLQNDRRSNNTFGHPLSDTTAGARIAGATITAATVPDGVTLAMITVIGTNTMPQAVYMAIDEDPVIPITTSFVFQPGTLLVNGAVKLISVQPAQELRFISEVANLVVQISFYNSERIV